MELASYPSIYNVGHRAVQEIFSNPVLIEEKIDGSQFSFGVHQGELFCRSKGARLVVDAPEKMFSLAVDYVKSIQHLLVEGWTYRGEYLRTPSHNTLKYYRIPKNHIMIFDIDRGDQDYVGNIFKKEIAERIGLETVPMLFLGNMKQTLSKDADYLHKMLDVESVLGGPKIEGFVIKNYHMYGPDKKVLMAKFVSEAFKEAHQKEWKVSNPGKADVVQALITGLRTDARWHKAIQHLRDAGQLTNTPRDIGPLLKEIQADILKENKEDITEALFKWAWPQISRGATAGFPEWYKEQLLSNLVSHTTE